MLLSCRDTGECRLHPPHVARLFAFARFCRCTWSSVLCCTAIPSASGTQPEGSEIPSRATYPAGASLRLYQEQNMTARASDLRLR